MTTHRDQIDEEVRVSLAANVSLAKDENLVHVRSRGSFKVDLATFKFLQDLHSSAHTSAVVTRGTLADNDDLHRSLQSLVTSGIICIASGELPESTVGVEPVEFVGSFSELTVRRDSRRLTAVVDCMARILSTLWTPRLVATLAFALPVALVFVFCRLNLDLAYSAWVDSPALVIAATISATLVRSLLHESGHMAAAKRYGVSTPSCGIGFYVHLPVLYVDLTELDTHDRFSRVHVDLAGIAIDSAVLIVAVAVTLLAFPSSQVLAAMTIGLAFSSLGPINPITKSDINWCLRDVFRARTMTASWGRPRQLWLAALNSNEISERRFARALLALTGVGSVILAIALYQSINPLREILSAAVHSPASLIPLLVAWGVTLVILSVTATAVRRGARRTSRRSSVK